MIKVPKPTIKKKYVLVATILILCLLVGILIRNHLFPKIISEDVPIVKTMVVSGNRTSQTYTYSGEVRGRYESQLAFQVGGKIIKRNIELGSVVKPGDILMQIDPKDLQQVVNSGLAQIYSAESQLRLADLNLQRYRQLYEQGVVSRAQFDQYQTQYDEAVAAARQASAQYTQSFHQLEYSELHSDVPGIVAAINAETGQVVGAGQIVVTVVRDGEREVEVNVPESRIDEIRKAQHIKVTFWALPGITVEGKIREIAPMADNTSRTFKVRISLLNVIPEVKLGMTASVEAADIAGQQTATPYIPLSALYQTEQFPAVWVVVDGTVKLRRIKPGNFGNGKIQVVEGLQVGDTIVTAGIHKLSEGQKVNTAGGDL